MQCLRYSNPRRGIGRITGAGNCVIVIKQIIDKRLPANGTIDRILLIPVYLLKLSVKNDRGVWRKIVVRADHTLDELHGIICRSLNYGQVSGYAFRIPPEGRSGTARKWLSWYYTHPTMFGLFVDDLMDNNGDQEAKKESGPIKGNLRESTTPDLRDATVTELRELNLRSRMRFEYLTGHGNVSSWREHVVYIEKDDAGDLVEISPVILEEKGVPEPL